MAAKKKSPPVQRRDGAGHLDPKYAQKLRELSEEGREKNDERAFVGEGHASDDLAEELWEEAVVAMTTGEDDLGEDLGAPVADDQGGPFVVTSGDEEFAAGTDASNPRGAKREPFPRT